MCKPHSVDNPHPLFWQSESRKKLPTSFMTFAVSWKLGCQKGRFHHHKVKYTDCTLKCLGSVKSVMQSRKSVSSQMCVNTMLVKTYGSHWLEKNMSLHKDLIIPLTKFGVQVLTVNDTVRHLRSEFLQFQCYKISRIYQLTTLQATL